MTGSQAGWLILAAFSLSANHWGRALRSNSRQSASWQHLRLKRPYASAADIAARYYWWLPVRLLMKDQFDSLSHIGRIDAPLLIVHGELDGIIPVAEGKRLFEAAKEPKEMVIIKDGSHSSISGNETWARELQFFERVHTGSEREINTPRE